MPIKSNTNIDVIPNTQKLFRVIFDDNKPHSRKTWKKYSDQLRGRRRPSHRKINEMFDEICPKQSNDVLTLKSLTRSNIFWDSVSSITKDECVVYDLSVPETHAFVANGFVNHNTFTLSKLAKFYLGHGKTIGLAAPTGRAAKRMGELAKGHEAKTIHRLLGYNLSGEWEYNNNNPLDYDIVILDECSMLDVCLAWRFFDAIDLDKTQVVLVGDD